MAAKVKGQGTKAEPWVLKTPSGSSEFLAYRDEALDPPALVVKVVPVTGAIRSGGRKVALTAVGFALAAIPAFACRDELDAHVARYRVNRDILIEALGAAGLRRLAPADGAFYLYADVSSLTDDSEDLCRRLLAATGVAITPGRDFDPIHGGAWVRLSFAGAAEDIVEAARRLSEWLKRMV